MPSSVDPLPPPVRGAGPGAALLRPALLPGLARLQRDPTSVQLGLEPPHAVVLVGLTAGQQRVLAALDGSLDRTGLDRLAVHVGLRPDEVADLLERLAERGLLVDAADPRGSLDLSDEDRDRLTPDLVSLALRHGSGMSPRTALHRRQRSWVDVRGAGRVGSAVATLLGAAGVGRVSVRDPTPAHPADQTPTGLTWVESGTSRELATRERLRAVTSSTKVVRRAAPNAPDLVVLAPDAGPDSTLVATWSRRSCPHLLAFVRESTGVVGPLVVPGETSCLTCLDLHRRDRDPGWPVIALQLGRLAPARACDVALATLVAAQAAMQVLAFLDGVDPVVREGTLETSLQSGVTRRRSWPVHPSCGCRWAALVDQPAAR